MIDKFGPRTRPSLCANRSSSVSVLSGKEQGPWHERARRHGTAEGDYPIRDMSLAGREAKALQHKQGSRRDRSGN
jgi:hypothetical protein